MAQVQCAVCEGYFRPGERFALQGYYVVHQACVGGIPRAEAMLSDVRRRVAALDHAIVREREDAQRLLSEVKDDLRRSTLERMVSRTEIGALRESRDTWQGVAENRQRVITELQAEVTRLRNNVPVASAGSVTPATRTPEQIPEPESEAVSDDTATRFALLEFD